MKHLLPLVLLAGALATPTLAQEGRPLLRVYMDAPYFYEVMLLGEDVSQPGQPRLELAIEGKEVGGSTIAYDCQSGTYEETVTTDYTGGAGAFVPAALQAYAAVSC